MEWYVPDCLRSHLKTIEITGLGSNNGVEQLRYFVENAKVLEKTIIKMKGGVEQLKLPKCSKHMISKISKLIRTLKR